MSKYLFDAEGNKILDPGTGKPLLVRSGGRKAGTPNKFTTAKQEFFKAFQELGGADFVIEVANSSPQGKIAVLNSLARLIPNRTEISGPNGEPIRMATVSVKVNLVRPSISGGSGLPELEAGGQRAIENGGGNGQ